MTLENFLKSDLWFNGPLFLLDSKEKWSEDISHLTSDVEEHEPEKGFLSSKAASTHVPVFQEERFSFWTKLVNTIAMVLLFTVKKSSLAKKHFSNERSRLFATAEIIICRQAQLIHPPSDVIKKQLNLYLCEKKLNYEEEQRTNR
ncbi:hypothetical protein RB195_013702 [Necator americanus]|uniref:Uncharacterized protein n=1 Tax=Necator americanus TaxID=51031 RepID=A0ABR1DXF0_NECAM